MRLLYVTERTPNRDPASGDGSSMIPYEVLLALPQGTRVTLLTYEGAVPVPPEVRERCERVVQLAVRRRWQARALSYVTRSHWEAHERSTRTARSAMRRLSGEAEVTLLHGPHFPRLAHQVSGPLLMQVVDPWSMRLTLQAELASPWRSRFLRHKARQALVLERALPARARLLSVAHRDAEQWAAVIGRAVGCIPNGVRVARRAPRAVSADHAPTVCFVGSLNYPPNVESVRVLVGEVAPLVWDTLPSTRFVLAGRRPSPRVLALSGGRVRVLADVPEVEDVFAAADVAVFPDRHGLGVRNSVKEALSSGLPVVATPTAARGQDPHPHLQVAAADLDVRGIAALVLAALASAAAGAAAGAAAAGAAAPADDVAVRTWGDAAADYQRELERVVGADPAYRR